MVEAELLCPDSDHTPPVEQNNSNHDSVKHYLGAEFEALLDGPEAPNSDELGSNSNDKKIGECQCVE